jgi:hypothetical protein
LPTPASPTTSTNAGAVRNAARKTRSSCSLPTTFPIGHPRIRRRAAIAAPPVNTTTSVTIRQPRIRRCAAIAAPPVNKTTSVTIDQPRIRRCAAIAAPPVNTTSSVAIPSAPHPALRRHRGTAR